MSGSTDMPPIVTRFAPSPTGFLHIGGVRTALFNWAFARRHGGTFLLRIEDTDRARSTNKAIDAIIDNMNWLGLNTDTPPVFQHQNINRHKAIAEQLLANGHGYKCTCTPEMVEAMRERARAAGQPPRYDGHCRDKPPDHANEQSCVVRLKAPQQGETRIEDAVQGSVQTANAQFDDLVLLRADTTPTYMLSVVVDDHDMGVTHIIRGDDHLTNTARQIHIYQALGWPIPIFAHVPLIHGADGAKLSKRHGTLGVEAYRAMGYLPEAMCNYLARLGWSHGNDELFTTAQLIDWFDLKGIGKSPARFDPEKLNHVNAHHIRTSPMADLVGHLIALHPDLAAASTSLEASIPVLRERAKSLHDLVNAAAFLTMRRPIRIDPKAGTALNDTTRPRLQALHTLLTGLDRWETGTIEEKIKKYMEEQGLTLRDIGPSMRAALAGNARSPGIFDVLALLGKNEALNRLSDQF